MKTLTKLLAFAVIMLVGSVSAQAQDPCITNLKDANSKTESGSYDEAIQLVNTTLKDCNLSKEDKIAAHKILITCYLAIDNLESADASAASIMKIDPNYRPDKTRDASEVVALFDKYKKVAVFRGGLGFGLNTSTIKVGDTYSIVDENGSEGLDNYGKKSGFQVFLYGEYRLYDELWINAGLNFRQNGFTHTLENVEGRTINYEETLTYFDIPVSAKYYFLTDQFQPYVGVGANFSFLNTSLGRLSRDDINTLIDRKPQRTESMVGYFAEAGLAMNIEELQVAFGVRFMNMPQDVNKEGTRYDSTTEIFQYYYLDNDFVMNHTQFNLSVAYNLGYKNMK